MFIVLQFDLYNCVSHILIMCLTFVSNSIIWRFKQLQQYPNIENKHINITKRHKQYQLKTNSYINMSDYPTTGITNPGGNDILCGHFRAGPAVVETVQKDA